MAQPQYNSVQELFVSGSAHSGDITLINGATAPAGSTGRWKGFMHTNLDGNTANVSITTFNGEGLTFEGIPSNTVIPVAFNRTYATGCTSTSASFKLWGLN
jgi:hypothetical protein|tara:strand:+ start:52 stop:354 length:303 start_codon:yes stop_codon:yes gene_type:complete